MTDAKRDNAGVFSWSTFRRLLGLSKENLTGLTDIAPRGTEEPMIDRFSECLSTLAYEPQGRFFWLNDGAKTPVTGMGCVFEVSPVLFADQATVNALERMLTLAWPEKTTIAVSLFASTRIETVLSDYLDARKEDAMKIAQEGAHVLRTMAEGRARLFAERARAFSDDETGVRHFRVWVSATCRVGEIEALGRMRAMRAMPSNPESAEQAKEAFSLQLPTPEGPHALSEKFLNAVRALRTTLVQFGIYRFSWDSDVVTRTMRELLNPQALSLASRKRFGAFDAPNSFDVLRDGFVFHDTMIDIAKSSVIYASSDGAAVEAVSLGVTGYPARTHLNRMREAMGALTNDGAVLRYPFLLTAVIEPTDLMRDKSMMAVRHARVRQLAGSEIGQFLTDLASRDRDLALAVSACEEAKGLARVAHAVTVWAKKGEGVAAAQSVQNVLGRIGMDAHVDVGLQMMGLLTALPMEASAGLMADVRLARRSFTLTRTAAAHFLPLFAEYQGTGPRADQMRPTPLLLLASRRGELFGVDPFANPNGNYNAVVAGTSGSGKSVLAQETVLSMLATGARVWVFDIGKSYQNCVGLTGGQWIDFARDENTPHKRSELCLNPLDMLDDPTEMLDELAQIVITMANGDAPMEMTQAELLKVAIANVVSRARAEGRTPTITDLTLDLMNSGDAGLKDTAVRLMPYAAGGRFAHWFEGAASVDFNASLVVLEMEALSNKPVLQNVVLLILIMRIVQVIRTTPRHVRKMIVIDEAWRLLTGNAGRFIEWACRTLRKYGAGIMCISQSMEDFNRTPTARAVRQNADSVFLLRQKAEGIAAYTDDPALVRVLSGLTTRAESFSEVYVRVGDAPGVVGRLMLDPFSMTAYSTRADVFDAVRKGLREGLTIVQAIERAVPLTTRRL